MSSRSIFDLHPSFQMKATEFTDAAKAAGLDVLIYCTLRSPEEQNDLYAQGRTTPGRIVTWARAGESAHNFGLAFDGVPLVNGKPEWNQKSPLWQTYGRVATSVGLEWAGHWLGKKREFPHVQMPNWRQVAGLTT